MTTDDLEIVVARTGHERFRWLTSDANPDVDQRDAYRKLVAGLAKNDAPAEYPPLAAQVGNALQAAVKFVASGGALVDQAEFDRRRSICEGCEHMDKIRDRCRACGCMLAAKPWSRVEQCPHGLWEV
jgi:hypothetical protein